MAEQAEQRTERATARRKKDARERGQVAVSRDVPAAAVLLAGLAGLTIFAGDGLAALADLMRRRLVMAVEVGAGTDIGPDLLYDLLTGVGGEALALTLPLLLGLAVVGTSSFLVQTGWLWTGKGLTLDPARLSPLAGLGRMVSWRSAVELVKSVLKVLAIAGVAYAAIRADLPRLAELGTYDLTDILAVTAALAARAGLWIGLAVAALAVADYAYQRFEWERGLRMTKEEVKREHREMEGDPMLRARVRGVQREMARKRMMVAVPKADVVVTNPTHLAVALQYDERTMAAPRVVAKGAGFVAERIKAVAAEHGVPVMEEKLVARSLYKLVDVGGEVPADLYRAVAEILALVYRAKGRVPRG